MQENDQTHESLPNDKPNKPSKSYSSRDKSNPIIIVKQKSAPKLNDKSNPRIIVRQKSAPKLKVRNDSGISIGKGLRKHHSSSIINLRQPDPSYEIRMLYNSNRKNHLKKDIDFSSDVDRYGFMILDNKKSKVTPVEEKEYENKDKDAKRSLKWANWVSQNKYVIHSGKFGVSSYVFPRNSKFFKRISKGIPDPWRSPVWYYLVSDGSHRDEKLVKIYKKLLKLPSTHERQIDLDIPRTLHTHIMFRTRYGPGQRALFNVLRAFSNYDKQVGYCQGMTNIVTILLMYYAEEHAFIMLTKLVARCNLHNLYIPGFPALMESFYIQEKLMNIYAPKILKHFETLQISTTSYSTRWYITLFSSDVVPHHTLLRIWDLLMLYGFDVLYFVAIALLKYQEETLLSYDFERALTMLSSTINVTDDDKLTKKIRKMYNQKGRDRLIDAYRDEYKTLDK